MLEDVFLKINTTRPYGTFVETSSVNTWIGGWMTTYAGLMDSCRSLRRILIYIILTNHLGHLVSLPASKTG